MGVSGVAPVVGGGFVGQQMNMGASGIGGGGMFSEQITTQIQEPVQPVFPGPGAVQATTTIQTPMYPPPGGPGFQGGFQPGFQGGFQTKQPGCWSRCWNRFENCINPCCGYPWWIPCLLFSLLAAGILASIFFALRMKQGSALANLGKGADWNSGSSSGSGSSGKDSGSSGSSSGSSGSGSSSAAGSSSGKGSSSSTYS
jgi:hypothetical protein